MEELKYFDSLYPPNAREKEIHSLIPFIEQGLSSQIIGIPGVGKSNILRLLAYNKNVRDHHFRRFESLVHFVYIDSSEIKGRPLIDITKFILLSLTFSLGERRMSEESNAVNNILKEGISYNDELLMFQSLKKALDYLSIEKKLSIHLMFDKFDEILPEITSQFFTNLKVLRNHAKYRFASIFALNRPINEITEPEILRDFHDQVVDNEIYISIYDKTSIKFRLDYIEKAARKKLPQKTREEIISLCGGHARLVKLAYEGLVAEEKEPENIKEYLLKKSTIEKALAEIWDCLLPAEKIALKSKDKIDQIDELHPYLVLSGIVGKIDIAIPLLKDYLEKAPTNTNSKITYDESKNEIFSGSTSISDLLSPLEFRLLKYMTENKERLCSKDEIINAVWKDTKTQEGVTDQALDQIFYRLRKKIETDPANPHFLQTIKGKGYRLVD